MTYADFIRITIVTHMLFAKGATIVLLNSCSPNGGFMEAKARFGTSLLGLFLAYSNTETARAMKN